MGGRGSGSKARYLTTSDAYVFGVRALVKSAVEHQAVYGLNNWQIIMMERRGHPSRRVDCIFDFEALRLELGYRRPDADSWGCEVLRLKSVRCHFGGSRWFACCPDCGRPTAALYGLPFACRRCKGLAYPTTRMREADRLLSRARKLRRQFGDERPNDRRLLTVPMGVPPKPPGKWLKRHLAIEARIEAFEQRALELKSWRHALG